METEEREESALACKRHIICFGQRAAGFCSASVTLLLHASWATQHQHHHVCFHSGQTYAAHLHCAVMWRRDDDVMARYCQLWFCVCEFGEICCRILVRLHVTLYSTQDSVISLRNRVQVALMAAELHLFTRKHMRQSD